MPPEDVLPSSFRDPAGFVFRRDGVLYRAIRDPASRITNAHVLRALPGARRGRACSSRMRKSPSRTDGPGDFYKIIRPEEVPFISYPYEWSFSQLQDAALATLEIEKRALRSRHDPRRRQRLQHPVPAGRPVLIDTLSLVEAVEGEPWTAYGQYCQHFLAPLALMSLRDVRLGQLLRIHLDGIPLDLALRSSPSGRADGFALLLHLHLHARSQKRYEGRQVRVAQGKVGRQALLGLVDSLESAIRKLRWRASGTGGRIITRTPTTPPQGSRTSVRPSRNSSARSGRGPSGTSARTSGPSAASPRPPGRYTVSFDVDPACVEMNYLLVRQDKERTSCPFSST